MRTSSFRKATRCVSTARTDSSISLVARSPAWHFALRSFMRVCSAASFDFAFSDASNARRVLLMDSSRSSLITFLRFSFSASRTTMTSFSRTSELIRSCLNSAFVLSYSNFDSPNSASSLSRALCSPSRSFDSAASSFLRRASAASSLSRATLASSSFFAHSRDRASNSERYSSRFLFSFCMSS